MNKLGTKLGAIAMSAVMAVSFAPSAVITTLAAGSDSTPLDAGEKSVPVYSVYEPSTGHHTLTTIPAEVTMLEALGWEGETPEKWYAPTTGDTVYRLFRLDNGDHFCTANAEEKDILVKDYGWTVDNNSFCTAASDDEKATYVYRLFKNGDGHHYTISEEEASILVKDWGWTLETGDGFYGYAVDQDSPVADELKVTLSDSTPKVGDILTAEVTGGKKPYTYQWLADGTAIADADGETLAITEDMVGKKISLKVTDSDSNTKTSEETAAVTYDYPEIVSAVRKAANSFTLNFDSDASEIVEADDIIVISEDETDVKKITGLDFDQLDGTTAVVTVNTPFKDGVTYNVIYGDSSASFVASVGEVAAIAISTKYAEVNTKTPIEFALFDENGVDVTSAVKVDEHCTVTFTGDYSNYENTKASSATVTMSTAGDVCTVTVEYNKNDGVSDIITASKDIECIPAGEKHGTSFFKAGPTDTNDTDGCFRFYDPKNSADSIVAVALNGDKLVHFYAQDDDGSAISYDSYEIESADETIATVVIDKATGKWASFTVTGNSKGLVLLTLTATKNGAETTYDIPVTVTEQAFPTKVTLTLSKKTMSNAWDEDYYGTVTMKVTAADGSDADTNTYNTHGFEILTKDLTVDDDLKTTALYAESEDTGFQLVDADADDATDDYTAFAAHGGSYVIEGSVTSLDTGKVLKATNTVTVSELPKEAWLDPDDVGQDLFILNYNDGGDEDDLDDITKLTKAETAAYPLLTPDEHAKLNPLTTLPGQLINRQAQKDADATYTGVVELAPGYDEVDEIYAVTASDAAANVIDAAAENFVLATVDDETGIATVINNPNDLKNVYAAPELKENKKTVYKITAKKGKVVATAIAGGVETISKDEMKNANKTALTDSTIFKVVPKYATQVVPGKDAYVDSHLDTLIQKGVDTSYAVEMTKTMGYADKTNKKTAKLYATMGGLFAGYVKNNGSIGAGFVVPTIEKRIINLGEEGVSELKDKATIDVQTYFGKTVVGTAEDDITTSPLYDVKDGRDYAPVRDAQGDLETIEQTFITVSGADNSRLFTAQKDQIKYDDDFARTGTEYKVVFRFWYVTSTKPVEESAAFSVENNLYTPKVTVKNQTLDSYTQDGWKDAVTSEVDLNNDTPSTYSVIDLVDKNFDTISSKTTPAKWAVVTEEGILFYIPLDRSFSLS